MNLFVRLLGAVTVISISVPLHVCLADFTTRCITMTSDVIPRVPALDIPVLQGAIKKYSVETGFWIIFETSQADLFQISLALIEILSEFPKNGCKVEAYATLAFIDGQAVLKIEGTLDPRGEVEGFYAPFTQYVLKIAEKLAAYLVEGGHPPKCKAGLLITTLVEKFSIDFEKGHGGN